MKTVTTKSLPHGTIPFAQIHDATLRDAMMKLNENIGLVSRRLKTVEEAVRELQRRAR